jgi:hypothetical protein
LSFVAASNPNANGRRKRKKNVHQQALFIEKAGLNKMNVRPPN